MKRVIFFANDFPPIGGAGVQRPYYFAKYLPEFGWAPEIVTVRDVVYPVKDSSVLAELPEEATIHRTESLELRRLLWHFRTVRRGTRDTNVGQDSTALSSGVRDLGRAMRTALFVPDDRILWLPFAIAKAIRIARKMKVDAVLATTPCYTAGVIGNWTSRILRVPLVLDLRDPWTRDPYMKMPTPIHAWLNRRFERKAFEAASKVIVISQRMADVIAADYPTVASKVQVITNGFDLEEFSRINSHDHGSGFSFVYVGSLYAHHLEAIQSFSAAWKLAAGRDAEFGRTARFVIVGRTDPEIEAAISRVPEMKAEVVGYVSHHEAIARLKGASALLLVIRNLDPDQHVITIPGKLFEYLAASKPVLMIGPRGDAADLVSESQGNVHQEEDIEGIAESMTAFFRGGSTNSSAGVDLAGRFDRRALAAVLACSLDEVSSGRSGETS